MLLRRYTETRRRHPLAPAGRVVDGIAAEQALTAPLHAAADLLIDTTDLPLPALRRLIECRFGPDAAAAPRDGLAVALLSFAFVAGLPREADMVLDAQFLRNPHYVSALKSRTGLDRGGRGLCRRGPGFRRRFSPNWWIFSGWSCRASSRKAKSMRQSRLGVQADVTGRFTLSKGWRPD